MIDSFDDTALCQTIAEMLCLRQRHKGKVPPDDYEKDITQLFGIDGDDAREFMKSYQHKFQVDMSNFRFNRYFSNEGAGLLVLVFGLFRNRKTWFEPLSVRQLAEIARARSWPTGVAEETFYERLSRLDAFVFWLAVAGFLAYALFLIINNRR